MKGAGKFSVTEQKEIIPDSSVKAAFMRREDIQLLPKKERERLWRVHLVKLDKFRQLLSNFSAVYVD